ncbi:hypothetical protein [Paenibacillus favisporus]|uniref:hypothetical protein n=1 Tax=Paenibacillus favisporus TaxID=221028 RepID=UPI003D26E53C
MDELNGLPLSALERMRAFLFFGKIEKYLYITQRNVWMWGIYNVVENNWGMLCGWLLLERAGAP